MDTLLSLMARVKDAERRKNNNSVAWTFYAWKLRRILRHSTDTYARMRRDVNIGRAK
jgi:hypothetical protein